MNNKKSGAAQPSHLQKLLNSVSVEEFLSGYWSVKPLHTRLRSDVFDSLISDLTSLESRDLLANVSYPVLIMRCNMHGDYDSFKVAASVAYEHFLQGYTLYFNVEPGHGPIARWRDLVTRDLGYPSTRARLSIFISPAGSVTPYHYDPNENLTVQLSGSKRWQLAADDQIDAPITRYTLACEAELPSSAHQHTNILLGESQMIYVPRGCWHKVTAIEESLSLNFCFWPATWADFIVGVLENELHRDAVWRENALGVWNQEIRSPAVLERIKDLVPRFQDVVARMSVDDFHVDR